MIAEFEKKLGSLDLFRPKLGPKLHFQRFEMKYLLDADKEQRIIAELAQYMEPDPFTEGSSRGTYEVVSLYYDSPQFYYYHEKIDGVQKRKKIRLRTYKVAGEFVTEAFFEIKRKHDAVILKDRFVFDAKKLIGGAESQDLSLLPETKDENVRKLLDEYEWENRMRSLSPKVLVTYEREPYVGTYNKNVRVTFDRDLKAIDNDQLMYAGNDFVPLTRGGVSVMEIKFSGALPHYIHALIRHFNLERIAYSKYCHGVLRCASIPGSFPGMELAPETIDLITYND